VQIKEHPIMKKFIVPRLTLFILFGLFKISAIFGQTLTVQIGIRDSIPSGILKESRKFIIYHPQGYDTSQKTYPVLYLLDGSAERLQFFASMMNFYFKDNSIIVAIQNTDRDRDMMPLSVPSYPVTKPGADNFLSFINNELIPYIETNNRTNGQRALCGQSLSGVFVLYALLTNPQLFDGYIANSAGWYADMDYFFSPLVDKAFQNPKSYKGKIIFIANSEIDSYDPKKEILKSMNYFSQKVQDKLGNGVIYKYETYSKYGHVPFPAFYDALKFLFANNPSK
jgi:predicted alpha/beta superfamily hydrolase